MFGPFRRPEAGAHSTSLLDVVRGALPESDDATHRIVAAIAGLLGAVAHADGEFSDAERSAMRGQLSEVQGLKAPDVDRLMNAVNANLVQSARRRAQGSPEISNSMAIESCDGTSSIASSILRRQITRFLTKRSRASDVSRAH